MNREAHVRFWETRGCNSPALLNSFLAGSLATRFARDVQKLQTSRNSSRDPAHNNDCATEDWPQFRGPRGDGTSTESHIPTTWSTTENIAWKVDLTGIGHSSPIVIGDRIFLTTCLDETHERVALCFDRKTGDKLWQRTLLTAPLEQKHPLNSYASATPASDGTRVYFAFFEIPKIELLLSRSRRQHDLANLSRRVPFHPRLLQLAGALQEQGDPQL